MLSGRWVVRHTGSIARTAARTATGIGPCGPPGRLQSGAMPRPLVFANGRLFVGVDAAYRIRELTYPQIGRFDHARDARIATGVWVDGRLTWCEDDGWERAFWYEPDAMVGGAKLSNPSLAIEIVTRESVAADEDVYTRTMILRNLGDQARDVRLFVTENLNVRETNVGDTVLWDPQSGTLVHFKERFAIAISLVAEGSEPMVACGEAGFGDLEGTFRDAEDGRLSGHPIAQGAVDATIGIGIFLEPGGAIEATLTIRAVEHPDWPNARATNPPGPSDGHGRRAETDRAWLAGLKVPTTGREGFDRLVRRSLLLIRAFFDHEGGIPAAYDNDILATARAHYGYVWPRDGALVAMVLDEVGAHAESRALFEFLARVPRTPRGGFWQKYGMDGTLGATWHRWSAPSDPDPVQPDESALVLLALRKHLAANPDRSFRSEVARALARPLTRFLLDHRDASGDPAPGYDLWEERRGIHAFTVAATIAALRAAIELLPGNPLAEEAREAADAMDQSWARWFGEDAVPNRSVGDPTADASLLMLASLGLRPQALGDDGVSALERSLWVPGIGGMARYPGDYYFRRREDAPGNPWIIATLWLAQALVRQGRWERASDLLDWVAARAADSGVLAEQYDAITGAPLSVGPLVWSHAEVVRTALVWERISGSRPDA